MKLRRMLSAVLAAVLLLTAPAAVLAEEAVTASYYAGELTATAIGDSYIAGNQLDLNVTFGVDATKKFESEKVQAVADLLAKGKLYMSFYDDFGIGRVHAEFASDDVTLLNADMLIYEDGSAQIMTNLTGNLVLALPAGLFADGQINLGALGDQTEYEYDLTTKEGIAAFRALPTDARLRLSSGSLASMLISHLLGWVSGAQMETGELYVFDDTYIDATETRDPVAQRMLGTIRAVDFNNFLWNVAASVCDAQGDFQQALADTLAEQGVTRYQVRRFVDDLLTEETIDPAVDFVQPSYYIIENNDGSLCEYDDVSYFFKKLLKCVHNMWMNSTENVLHMDISYDDFGTMVGFDAELAQFTTVLPYEGTFTYSLKTDDYWQQMHTAHGELQVFNDNRIVGDLRVQNGEDVDGVNANAIVGYADVVNQKDDTSVGVGVNAAMDYTVSVNEDGSESELFEGSALLGGRENGEESKMIAATVSGMTTTDDYGFGLSATAALELADTATLMADATLEQAEYMEIPFAGGQAIDLTALDEEKKDMIKKEVVAQAAKMSLGMITKPGLLSSLTTLFLN